jgi:integrase
VKGFMRQRGSAWELRVFVGTDAVTGKKRYTTQTVRGGKREAQRALAQMVTDAELGLSARTSATVAELIERWFEFARSEFSPKTVKETRGMIDRYVTPSLGSVTLSKLRAHDLDRFYRDLQAKGGAGGSPLAAATVRRVHGILRRALGQGVKWGWIGVNPAVAASPPRVLTAEIRPPSPTQVAALLARAQASAPDLACYLMLSAGTGARRSELVALRWSDVDLAGRSLVIRRGVVAGPDGLVEKDTKTHASRRVALDDGVVAALSAHRARQLEMLALAGVAMSPSPYVFSDELAGTTPWYPDSVSRRFRRLCERDGLVGVRLHDLRHFVATQLLSAGVDVRTVAGRLGHRNAATTLNVYAHVLEQSDRQAADIMRQTIDRSAPQAPEAPSVHRP